MKSNSEIVQLKYYLNWHAIDYSGKLDVILYKS